jgi:hypothetical protein
MSARSDASRLLELVGANWTTQAIGAAVSLGVVDQLAEAPQDADELSQRTQCDRAALSRLLRALVSIGVVALGPDRRHALTPLGHLLREDVPGSVRGWALWCSGPQWSLWGDLARSVRTGRSARERAGGRPGYAHLEADAAAAELFNRAMAGLTGHVGREVARLVHWGDTRCVVDVGGGYGELLVELLAARPALQGIVFDLPHAAQGATERLARAGLRARCSVATGSFFEALPEGADAYLLKSILHNWDDAQALAILRQCRAAMPMRGRLLVVERVVPDRPRGGRRERAVVRSDLNMLVSLAGRERTRGEFAALLAEAGFGPPLIKQTALDYSVIETLPAVATVGRGRPARAQAVSTRSR